MKRICVGDFVRGVRFGGYVQEVRFDPVLGSSYVTLANGQVQRVKDCTLVKEADDNSFRTMMNDLIVV